MTSTIRILVRSQADVEQARRDAAGLASSLDLSTLVRHALVLVVSELGANLVRYGKDGMLTMSVIRGKQGDGVEIVSEDCGPGIANVDLALLDGFSTGGGMGSGLPAVRRLMDEFTIRSGPDGTWIQTRLWAAAGR